MKELLHAAIHGGDAERAVYADWLEQHGDPVRAQVIHLQCELARQERDDRRALELGWELDAVLAELGDRWRAALPVLEGIEWLALERGLCTRVRAADGDTLLAYADAIAAAAPVSHVELASLDWAGLDDPAPAWLRVLRVSEPADRVHPLVRVVPELEVASDTYDDIEWLERDAPLERLRVVDNRGAGGALGARLVGAKWAKDLVELALSTTWIDYNTGYGEDPRLGEAGARALAKLTRLQVLAVDRQHVGAAIGGLFELPALRELSARACDFTVLPSLATVTGAPLERLDLGHNAIRNAGATELARAPRLATLRRVVLDTCEIESHGLAEIARASWWGHLRHLDLARNPLGPGAARVLADSPVPDQLCSLVLADVDFDDTTPLATIPWLGRLAVLDLSDNALGDLAAALRGLDAIRVLSLARTGLARTGAAGLAKLWAQLVALDLSSNPLTDAGLERFASMREASKLQRLSLADCKLGDDGLELLTERGRAPRLRELELSGNAMSGAAVAKLLASRFAENVETLNLSRSGLDASVLVDAIVPPHLRTIRLFANKVPETTALALATSPTFQTVRVIELEGDWHAYSVPARAQLDARFGPGWRR